MSNTTTWRFHGTPATYVTPSDKFETTVTKLRSALNIHPDHKIEILHHDVTESTTNNSNSSHSNQYADKLAAISKPAKVNKTVEETTELPPVLGDVDSADPEFAAL